MKGPRPRPLDDGEEVPRPEENSATETAWGRPGAEGQNRTADTTIFSRVLYLLSYLGERLGDEDSNLGWLIQSQLSYR